MDIGTLTGSAVIIDNVSDTLDKISKNIKDFGKEHDSVMGKLIATSKLGVAAIVGVTTAVAAMGASILALGSRGSTLLGVEQAFNRLAEAAGSTGEALIGGLSAGVRGTIDSMELMQTTTRLLSSGMQVTAQQMELLGATARELGKATGTDATNALNTLSTALTTGNDRALKRLGIHVDLVQAEKNFAASIDTTRDQLSQAGILEARRIAFLGAMDTYLQKVGRSELSLKERIQQTTVAIGDWFDSLAKGVASSNAVNKAFETIWTSLQRTFGPASQLVLQTLLRGIDAFANAVARLGPSVISTFGTIAEKIISLGEAAAPAFKQLIGIITDTLSTIGSFQADMFGDIIDALADLGPSATEAFTSLRRVISDVVTFAICH